MALELLPCPQRSVRTAGFFRMPPVATIGIPDHGFQTAARCAGAIFGRHQLGILVPGVSYALAMRRNSRLRPDGYRLRIARQGVTLEAGCDRAAFHGMQTLLQIARQSPGGRLPCLRIDDWPDFADRGVYYDISRGRVPRLERLLEMVDLLAHYKLNTFQLYIEHTFLFRGHPDIGEGASPLTAEDILTLDRHCRERHVELIPSLATFGHCEQILKIPRFRHLAENGRLRCLSPAHPGTYALLDSLFSEFLPLFSSDRFNICCDEVNDLGAGQSAALCRRKGKGRVYLDHIRKLSGLAARHGKKVMFWGDMIRHHPECIPSIPRHATVLDWGYDADHRFSAIKDFTKERLPTIACPGTSSWVSLFPRLPEAMANIAGFAAAGRKAGARGLLNTDWGDGGHYNFMECSWHGYAFGAEQAWNTGADRDGFTGRFVRTFLHSPRRELAGAITRLGELAHLGFWGRYQSIWPYLFFAPPTDQLFRTSAPMMASRSSGNRISFGQVPLDARLGRKALATLARISRTLGGIRPGEDPHGVVPYWSFAADTLAHAARKLAVLAPGGTDSPQRRRELRDEMLALRSRFTRLWLARNRRSNIGLTLDRYAAAIASLRPRAAVRAADAGGLEVSIRRGADCRVGIYCSDGHLALRYTIDGADPGPDSPVFSKPFPLPEGGTVRVQAVLGDGISRSRTFAATFGMDRRGWRVVRISLESPFRNYGCSGVHHLLTDDPSTYWQTYHTDKALSAPPHEVVLDMGRMAQVAAFTLLPRSDPMTAFAPSEGTPDRYSFHLSDDGTSWRLAATEADAEDASGQGMRLLRLAQPRRGRFIRFVADHAVDDGTCIIVAGIGAVEAGSRAG